ncbi:hypothetical protein EV193_101230 [Herbihabitans rhizosphaerae]|uniref:Uncharacterized protein n=1 Tax=Herbihabitans rhizosphaerae TaxID=1872711 RepID=A0A4Q7L4X8_9PSEU|nr:hypothetical protein [Herbihabitans rhizosphaerae]RZS44355.1 hypothetical protein EV193_101230 [Herbihabitans rhizosphaerae]
MRIRWWRATKARLRIIGQRLDQVRKGRRDPAGDSKTVDDPQRRWGHAVLDPTRAHVWEPNRPICPAGSGIAVCGALLVAEIDAPPSINDASVCSYCRAWLLEHASG